MGPLPSLSVWVSVKLILILDRLLGPTGAAGEFGQGCC